MLQKITVALSTLFLAATVILGARWTCGWMGGEELAGMDFNPESRMVGVVITSLQRGADPNVEFNGQVALDNAAEQECFEVVAVLLKYGARPQLMSGHHARLCLQPKNWAKIERKLMSLGADPVRYRKLLEERG